jgi:hypothetical protein
MTFQNYKKYFEIFLNDNRASFDGSMILMWRCAKTHNEDLIEGNSLEGLWILD